jgi:hypothetical protein
VTWPGDFATALAVLIFLMIILWWRNRFPSRYDITLRKGEAQDDDKDDDVEKPSP